MVLASCASNTASTDDDERLVSTKATIENRKLDELLHENELFRAVLDNFPGGISLFDRNLRLVLCNRELKGLLQYPKSLFEYGPPSLEQIFRFNATRGEYGPGNVEELVAQKMKLVNLQRSHVYERTRPNGTVLEVRGAPLANGGFVTTYLDVTHQRAARQVETQLRSEDTEGAGPGAVALAHTVIEDVLHEVEVLAHADSLPQRIGPRRAPPGEGVLTNRP